MRSLFAITILALLPALCACSDGGKTNGGPEVIFGPPDLYTPPPEDVGGDEPDTTTVDEVEPPPVDAEVTEEPEIPVTPPGCGDGICQGAETPQSCAKDCLETTESAAFVFAHKGDEVGALGRIWDLTQAGADVHVFYLTFDDTPIGEMYDNSAGKLAVVSLGVPEENVYLYETANTWSMVTGNHEVTDRLTQHLITTQPDSVYLPQLCGGELEDELAHVVAVWASKRAKIFPAYYELPAPSNYYVTGPADPALIAGDADAFVQHVIKRWKLLPKDTPELKPTLGGQDMAQLRLAAAHIMNPWLQEFLYKLPEEKVLYLLREMQRYRELPPGQQTDEKPWMESLENPDAGYIYVDQGYTFDEFRQLVRVTQSFFGANLRTQPRALPWFDEPHPLYILQQFEVTLDIRGFSPGPESDTLTFLVGEGPAKNEYANCTPPPDLTLEPLGTAQVTIPCKAVLEQGKTHTLYFRAYSSLAKENNDPALFTEVPFVVGIGVN